jgi:hypothetical protein
MNSEETIVTFLYGIGKVDASIGYELLETHVVWRVFLQVGGI